MRLRTSGFTLVELLVVLTVIGVLAVTVVPYVSGSLRAVSLSATARELVAAARIAQSRAVTSGVEVRLVVDERGGRFRVEERRREPDEAAAGSAGRAPVASGSLFTPVRDLPGASGEMRPGVRVEVRAYRQVPLFASASGSGRSVRSRSGARASSPGSASSTGRTSSASGGSASRAKGQSVLFRPDGTTESRELLLRDADGFGLRLRLLRATGRVEIDRLPREAPAAGAGRSGGELP